VVEEHFSKAISLNYGGSSAATGGGGGGSGRESGGSGGGGGGRGQQRGGSNSAEKGKIRSAAFSFGIRQELGGGSTTDWQIETLRIKVFFI
jgi:hypothetical protein